MSDITTPALEWFDAVLIPMWVYDPETLRFLAVNKAAIANYGYSRADFLQMTLANIRSEEDMPAMQANIDRNVKPFINAPQTERWRHRRKNGELFYVQLFATYVEFEGKPARLVQAVDIDEKIKEQQRQEDLNKVLRDRHDDIDFVLSTMNEVVWVAYADDMQLIYTNEACEKMQGYTAQEMIADNSLFFKSIHPDDVELFKASTKRMLETGYDVREFRVYHKDGSIRYLRGGVALRKNVDGKRDICCGLTVDITELKLAQGALAQQVHDTEDMLDSITDGFFTLNRNWEFTYVNKAFEKLYDTTREHLLGRNYWEHFPTSTKNKFHAEYNRAIAENKSVHFEEYSNSQHKWLSVSAYPRPQGLSVYFTDITEQKELKDALVKHEHNLNALINTTNDLIWSLDTDYRLLSANNSYIAIIKQFTGRAINIGDRVIDTNVPAEQVTLWKGYFDRAFDGEQVTAVDEYELGGNSSSYWETSFNPIVDEHGSIMGVSCFSTDITDRLNHLLKIELQNKQLKEIAQMQSHQVRGPVATIMGLQQLLNADDPADPINNEVIQGINISAQILDAMIRDIDSKTRMVFPEV